MRKIIVGIFVVIILGLANTSAIKFVVPESVGEGEKCKNTGYVFEEGSYRYYKQGSPDPLSGIHEYKCSKKYNLGSKGIILGERKEYFISNKGLFRYGVKQSTMFSLSSTVSFITLLYCILYLYSKKIYGIKKYFFGRIILILLGLIIILFTTILGLIPYALGTSLSQGIGYNFPLQLSRNMLLLFFFSCTLIWIEAKNNRVNFGKNKMPIWYSILFLPLIAFGDLLSRGTSSDLSKFLLLIICLHSVVLVQYILKFIHKNAASTKKEKSFFFFIVFAILVNFIPTFFIYYY